jgi:hypothetical protein
VEADRDVGFNTKGNNMNQAPVRQRDVLEPGIPHLDPDASDEPKTEPRIRAQLLLAPEPSGVVPRVRASVLQAGRALVRLKLAPAVVLGALLGSAPYLVEQHVRASAAEEPGIVAQQVPAKALETSQLAAASMPAPPAQAHAPAPQPPPSAIDRYEELSVSQPRQRSHAIERTLLTRARKQLRDGDGFGAQLALERLDSRIPRGNLMRPRKLLEIQVLQAIGATAAARRAANDFAKAYPRSPELRKLSALLLGS